VYLYRGGPPIYRYIPYLRGSGSSCGPHSGILGIVFVGKCLGRSPIGRVALLVEVAWCYSYSWCLLGHFPLPSRPRSAQLSILGAHETEFRTTAARVCKSNLHKGSGFRSHDSPKHSIKQAHNHSIIPSYTLVFVQNYLLQRFQY
jgi:hypothetical protein